MTTKADQQRLSDIGNIPCVCCSALNVQQPSLTERHHLVDRGNRKASGGHHATVALCGWHHRAIPLRANTIMSNDYMLKMYGPSMKYQDGKGNFEKVFGSQRDLLAMTNKLLDTVTGNKG